MILENLFKLEEAFGTEESQQEAKSKMPKRVKKRRKMMQSEENISEAQDEETGWEEFYELVFPEENKASKMKILEIAERWKKEN